ncbi:MAG: mannosyltransferase [Hyphomicrobiales bacterium]|jgi:glycosyltransferase involved in cell wall biosynthesis|nr:mannosyltransferase [Hyphomicrobiales bacterium]
MGGAARYLGELEDWLLRNPTHDIRLVGRGRRLSPWWLVRRELSWPSGPRVALNNVGFVTGGSRRTLLRNALHFLDDAELAQHGAGLPRTFGTEVRIVRSAARRSDELVVPCTAMAERVARVVPALSDRLVVRHHPLSAPALSPHSGLPAILVPVLFAPYKRMDEHLQRLLDALDRLDIGCVVRPTATRAELPGLVDHPRIDLVGHLSPAEVVAEWARSTAAYYPTGLESFGYPLAEARAAGRPIIALDSAQNLEIAAGALRGFRPNDPGSLADAVGSALSDPPPAADPSEFHPDHYFDWLMGDR